MFIGTHIKCLVRSAARSISPAAHAGKTPLFSKPVDRLVYNVSVTLRRLYNHYIHIDLCAAAKVQSW